MLLGRARPTLRARSDPSPCGPRSGASRASSPARPAGRTSRAPAVSLAVVRQEGDERLLELWDGTRRPQRTLFRTTGAITYVRISPDEKQVAFIHHPSRLDDAGEVMVVPVSGAAEARAVSERFQRCAGLDWHPRTGQNLVHRDAREHLPHHAVGHRSRGLGASAALVPRVPGPERRVGDGRAAAGVRAPAAPGLRCRRRRPPAATSPGWARRCDRPVARRALRALPRRRAHRPQPGHVGAPARRDDAVRIADGDPGRFSPDGNGS